MQKHADISLWIGSNPQVFNRWKYSWYWPALSCAFRTVRIPSLSHRAESCSSFANFSNTYISFWKYLMKRHESDCDANMKLGQNAGSIFVSQDVPMIEPPRGLDGSQLPDIMEAGDSQWFWEHPGDNMDKPWVASAMSARASAAWRGINIATWLPQCDLWHKYWLGSPWSLWKSAEFLGFQLQPLVLVEIFQQNLPNFCACPFQVCSILLQFGTTWVPCLHQYLWFMAPWPQNACHCIYHISLSVGPITLQSFPPFTVGEAPMRPSRRMESMHTTRDAQSCQSWAQDWSTGQM